MIIEVGCAGISLIAGPIIVIGELARSVGVSSLPYRPGALMTPKIIQILGAVVVFGIVSGPARAQGTEESKSENIGPWEIDATYKADRFDRCSISRTLQDDVVASLVRTADGLMLVLQSPNWKLEREKTYPVKMSLGQVSWDADVAAEPNSVSIEVGDKKFRAGLRTANPLNVVGAGATIRVPLDKSTLALDRLDQCFEKNSHAIETNPFVEPKRQP
jgi:hypothetical protein